MDIRSCPRAAAPDQRQIQGSLCKQRARRQRAHCMDIPFFSQVLCALFFLLPTLVSTGYIVSKTIHSKSIEVIFYFLPTLQNVEIGLYTDHGVYKR